MPTRSFHSLIGQFTDRPIAQLAQDIEFNKNEDFNELKQGGLNDRLKKVYLGSGKSDMT